MVPLIYTFYLFSSTSFFVCLCIILYSEQSQRPNRNQLLMYPIAFNPGFPAGISGKELYCQCRRHETWVQSLHWQDPLEEEMATNPNILAWRIPWTEEPGKVQSIGSQRAGHGWNDLACTHIALNPEGVLFHCLAFCDFYLVPLSSRDTQNEINLPLISEMVFENYCTFNSKKRAVRNNFGNAWKFCPPPLWYWASFWMNDFFLSVIDKSEDKKVKSCKCFPVYLSMVSTVLLLFSH